MQDMIDIVLYRFRIGVYCKKGSDGNLKVSPTVSITGKLSPENRFLNLTKILSISIIYVYTVLCMLGMIIGMLLECKFKNFALARFYNISDMQFENVHITHVKLLSTILLTFLITRDLIIYSHFGCFIGLIGRLFNSSTIVTTRTESWTKKCLSFISQFILWTFVINSMLIIIINPSLLNPGPIKAVKVISFNCQGLIPFSDLYEEHPKLNITKIHEINQYLVDHKPDIVMLNETWLKKSINNSEFFPTDVYKPFRLDRSPKTHPPDPNDPKKFRKNGGGVFIAIRRDLDIKSTKVEFHCAGEIIGVTLKFNDGRNVILCSYYRVGTLGMDNHNEFKNFVKRVRSRKGVSGIVIAGDLNLCRANWDSYSTTDKVEQAFLDSFSNFGLEQLINVPTHKLGKMLDLVLTDKPGLISNLSVSDFELPCYSDHFCVSFSINCSFKRIKLPKREVYNYKRANWEALNQDLNCIDWDSKFQGDIHEDWQIFKRTLFDLMDLHIPKVKIGGICQPSWFDAETHQLCREKERLHKEYKGTDDPDLKLSRYLKFSMARKKFKEVVSCKMDNSFDDEDDSGLITKKFWSYVKATSKNTRIPELVFLDETYKSNPCEQAELYNSYFYKQFSEASNYNINLNCNEDFDIDFSKSRVKNLLDNLNVNKAMGPDKINGRVLKNCSNSLSTPLSIMFDKCYRTSSIPDEWKAALVVPVHKKGSKSNVENYRPISLTCIIIKIMERIIRDEIMLKCGHLIDDRQHGFLKSKSCTTQLVNFCDSLALSLNDNIRSDVIYFDFAKAFDSVNHDLILNKLKNFFKLDGILLKFVAEYLKGRTQSVVVGGFTSAELPVLSGVPQGSILGPTLFVLFLNDIVEGLDPSTNIIMYADDTKIWRRMEDPDDHLVLQKDIDYLFDWALKNKMRFHPSKCKVLMVSRFYPPLVDVLPFVQFCYTMENKILDYVSSERDLGVIMNRTLNFTEHANSLYSKANQRLGLLKRTCHFVNNTVKRRVLYLTMVRSIFEHCPVIWQPSSNTVISRLESLQKRAIKWINQDISSSYSLDEQLYHIHCKQLNILPIQYRFIYHDLKLFHLIIYNFSCIKLPKYMHFFQGGSRLRFTHLDHLSIVSDIIARGHHTNSSSKKGFSNSYFYRTHLLWNRLPLTIREIIRPSVFKAKLIDYIWSELVIINESEYEHSDSG